VQADTDRADFLGDVAGDLTTLGAERIDAGSFAKRQIISQ
jgi:hypothetical protein